MRREAFEPVLRGDDALLLALAAGGKTEAATFPILTRMAAEGWTGLSVVYLCPLKALLNNLLRPRHPPGPAADQLASASAGHGNPVTAPGAPHPVLTPGEEARAGELAGSFCQGEAEPKLGLQLDYVGSVGNAAKVIAALHRGEKRLVFADSKRLVEVLGAELRERGVTTHLVHASLSLDERRRAEEAFAAGRDCVIVSTSALELGIDVGDLDRVIQVNSPPTVAAFLQRLGRSGRRAGTVRNMLFLALDEDQFLLATGLLLAWSRGFVEPVAAPPDPRHIVAQQVLALCLQEGRVGEKLWQEWLPLPGLLGDDGDTVAEYLAGAGFVEREDGMLFIGPEAERRFGMRHLMGLMAVFTAPPEFTVLHGREEVGRVDPVLLVDRVDGPRLLLLGGRSWLVSWTDWKRRRCFVVPFAGGGGRARWLSGGVGGLSLELALSMRDVLLGSDPPVELTRRASGILAGLRSDGLGRVATGRLVISETDGDLRWWTWAGYRVNATLQATLSGVAADPTARVSDLYVRLRPDLRASTWPPVVRSLAGRLMLPSVDEKALQGLKFSDALPRHLAEATLATRLADLPNAAAVLREAVRFER